MSRLTNETLENAINTYKTVVEACDGVSDDDYCPILDKVTVELLEELKEYRNLEEQGLLLKLPCKVGDVVYHPSKYWKRVFEYAVIGICVYTEDIWIKCGNGYSYILGREIFLTKAEAEKALAEMEK